MRGRRELAAAADQAALAGDYERAAELAQQAGSPGAAKGYRQTAEAIKRGNEPPSEEEKTGWE